MIYSLNISSNWSQLKKEFEQRGVVTLDIGFSEKLIDRLAEKLSYWYQSENYPKNYDDAFRPTRVLDAWRFNEDVCEFALHKKLLSLLAFLYGDPPYPFQTLNFIQGTEQPVHSDSIHFNSEPFGKMCGVWLALEDIDKDQGPLVYYPGSHLLSEMNYSDIGLTPNGSDYSEYNQFVKQLIIDKEFKPEYGLLKKGHAVLWAANLLHGGSKRESNKSRLSQVTHYYFENSKYWRPSLSKDKRHYFTPPLIKPQRKGWLGSFFKQDLR